VTSVVFFGFFIHRGLSQHCDNSSRKSDDAWGRCIQSPIEISKASPEFYPCRYWHGACGERFEGPQGWAAAADGYQAPDVSSPALLRDYKKVLADYTARTQRPLNHVRDFLDCIRSRRPPVANPDVMCRSMNICLAADICEQLQRNLKFDLRRAEFVGDPEANRLRSRVMRVPYTI
jgi:hypothetical protein